MFVNAKKGLSAKQMQGDLGVTYKTAWFLCHRIRKAMNEGFDSDPFTGEVEVDETYSGGKFDKRRKRERWIKEPVFGIIERGGRVRAVHMPKLNRWQVMNEMKATVSPDATVYSDESRFYNQVNRHFLKHEIVIHSDKEWIRGEAHTQSIDGFWSLFKRGLVGSFHQISIKHLQRYLDEFNFRFSNRDSEDMFAMIVFQLVIGTALQYKELTAKASELASPSDDSDVPF